MKDKEFVAAKFGSGICQISEEEGEDKTEHHPTISEDDLQTNVRHWSAVEQKPN
jgi:hypothetical protein